MLRASVEDRPNAEAIVEIGGARPSYRQLWDRASRGLKKQCLKRGDRAAIRLGNGADWVTAFWRCQLAGVVTVPGNTRFTDKEAQYVINDSGASWVFEKGASLPDGPPEVIETLKPDDLAGIFCTSGSTGVPKGVMTHRNFPSNCEARRRVKLQPRYTPGALRHCALLEDAQARHYQGAHDRLGGFDRATLASRYNLQGVK